MPANLNGLSDFGLGTPTQSNSVSGEGGGLDELLGNDILDETGKARLLETQISQIQASGTRSPLDVLLKSPRGIATLLASIGGIAAGGDARAVGIGGLMGALQKAQGVAEAERSQKSAAIEELNEDLEKSQGRLDKSRNRVATMFNTNPEAFLDAEGRAPDPRVLGWYMTGTDIPIFANSRLRNRREDMRWNKTFDVLKDRLENAQTPEDSRQLTEVMLKHLDWDNPPAEVIDALSRSRGTDEFNTTLAGTYMRNAGPSALDAMIYAGENNLPLHHPDVVRKLSFTGTSDVTPSQVINQKWLDLMNELNQWANRPENVQTVLGIKQEAKDSIDSSSKLAELAFEGRPGDIDLYKNKQGLLKDRSLAEMTDAYGMVSAKFKIAEQLEGLGGLDLTEEERRRMNFTNAVEVLDDAEKAAKETTANRFIQERVNVSNRLNTDLNIQPPLLYAETTKIINAALSGAQKNTDGTMNMESFQVRLRQELNKYIEENK